MAIYDITATNTSLRKTNSIKVDKGIRDLTLFNKQARPLAESNSINNENRAIPQLSTYGFSHITLYDVYALSKYADILQLIFNARNREIFRNGIEVEPVYDVIDKGQQKRAEDILYCANENGQSLIEVLQEWSKDLDVIDDAYLLCVKDYYFNENLEIQGGKVREVLRIDPLSVMMMLDGYNRLGRYEDGRIAYVSVSDRTKLTDKPIDKDTGKQNLVAHYKVYTAGGEFYYNKSEMLHKSAYNPSITYGYSNLFSLYNKVLILLGQDFYIKNYYTQDKPLKGLLAFNTNNWESLKKVLEQIDEEKKRHPHKIFPIPFQNSDNRKPVEYIDMSKTLTEMQYTETRNEIRNQIGAMYGVSPIFQNDMSTSGGLNNEGLQITVTNRAIEDRQSLINDFVMPFIFKFNMGITTFDIYLRPSEQQDEIHEEELEAKRIANAKGKLELGMKGSVDEEGNFTFREGELELKETQTDMSLPFQSEEMKQVDIVTPVDVGKAEYQGRDVKLNKPFREVSGNNQYAVYVQDGESVKKVRFGSAEMENKRDDPDARRSFRARFKCEQQHPKTGATYWACKFWSSTPVNELLNPKSEVEGDKIEKVSKADVKIPKQEQTKFRTNLEKELDKILNKLDFKQKPTENELNKVVEELTSNLDKQLKVKSSNRVKAIYNKAKKQVGRELKTKLPITPTDKGAIEALKRNPELTSAITSMTNEMKKKAYDIIQQSYENPENFTIDKITENLKKELDESNSKLRTIARTETTKISVNARKNTYDQTGKEYRYYHIGPSDNRTTKASQEMKQLTKNGVTWGEYLSLMKRVVSKYNPKWSVDESFPLTHPNTRHLFIARPVKEN